MALKHNHNSTKIFFAQSLHIKLSLPQAAQLSMDFFPQENQCCTAGFNKISTVGKWKYCIRFDVATDNLRGWIILHYLQLSNCLPIFFQEF